jgi:integrase
VGSNPTLSARNEKAPFLGVFSFLGKSCFGQSGWSNPTMRLAHHLLRHPSGTWHFRLVVPRDLQAAIGRKIIKQSLRTKDGRIAQAWAYTLGARYAQTFATLRGKSMGWAEENEAYLASLIQLEVQTPDGFKFRTDGSDRDHAQLKDILTHMRASGSPFSLDQLEAELRSQPRYTQAEKVMTAWLEAIKDDTLPKTLSIKALAIRSFVDHYGKSSAIWRARREDVSAWVADLRSSGLATPTLANKAGYVSGFFAWCEAQGYYAPFRHERDNPAFGVVPYRKKDKRRRAKEEGYVAYTVPEIQKLFDPDALKKLPIEARWGIIIGLYTGARVGEVGQLALKDVIERDDIPCIHITDTGAGQRLKTEASDRTIPIHPHLLAFGFMDRVKRLRQAGETQFFPAVKIGGVNGMGNWLTKAYARYRELVGITPPVKGRHGFHSFRETVIQALQDLGVSAELRAAYVGHELDDEHFISYCKEQRPSAIVKATLGLSWGLDIRAIQALMH